MTPDTLKHLQQLELSPSATWDEVQTAYRDLIKIWHPDRFPNDERLKARAELKAKELNEAIRALRRHYRKTMLIRRDSMGANASGVFTAQPGAHRAGAHQAVRPSGENAEKGPGKPHSPFEFESSNRGPIHRSFRRRYPDTALIKLVATNLTIFCGVCFGIAALSSIGLPDFRTAAAAGSGAQVFGTHGSGTTGAAVQRLDDYRLVAAPGVPRSASSERDRNDGDQDMTIKGTPRPRLIQVAMRCNATEMKRLISSPLTDLDETDENGDTALAWTARLNCLSGAKLLLGAGASTTTVARNGFTPLSWAQWARNTQIEELIHHQIENGGGSRAPANGSTVKSRITNDQIVARPSRH